MRNHLTKNILIAGAGLVGLSFALSMQKSNCVITLLETHLPDILSKVKTDSRPISLSYGSVRILKSLGIWDVLEHHACPILSVHVSEKGRFGFTEFLASEQKVPALGYVVPIAHLQTALYEAVALKNNIIFKSISAIKEIIVDSEGAHVQADSEILHADLFIAADGTNSICRNFLHIPAEKKMFDDAADIYQLFLSEEHRHVAYERFTDYGVLAVLPLQDKHHAQLVWTTTLRIAEKIARWNAEDVLAFLQSTFEGRLAITHIKKSAHFPLQTVIAEKQVVPHAVLLGNAAHTIYPVAAQGFNLGLHDADLLSLILCKAIEEQKNIGDITLLEKYESRTLTHQRKIYKMTTQLIGLFELPLLGCARGLGLLGVELLKPIKNKLAKRAMGINRE